jgi:hypothetical protein
MLERERGTNGDKEWVHNLKRKRHKTNATLTECRVPFDSNMALAGFTSIVYLGRLFRPAGRRLPRMNDEEAIDNRRPLLKKSDSRWAEASQRVFGIA